MMDSNLAYFAITGIQQIISSVLVIVIAHTRLGITSRNVWTRILAIAILLNFAFNFAIAVSSSTSATFYNQMYKGQLELSYIFMA